MTGRGRRPQRRQAVTAGSAHTVKERPCPCWVEVSLHSGHCCFSEPGDACLADEEHYRAGKELMELKKASRHV